MATLVLGAVGTAIGGAMGGTVLGLSGAAIGGMIHKTPFARDQGIDAVGYAGGFRRRLRRHDDIGHDNLRFAMTQRIILSGTL